MGLGFEPQRGHKVESLENKALADIHKCFFYAVLPIFSRFDDFIDNLCNVLFFNTFICFSVFLCIFVPFKNSLKNSLIFIDKTLF